VYAAFLQNAPVVRHTRGFTPGWYALPRWGTPNASPFPEPPPPPRPQRPQRHHHNTPDQRRLFFLNGDHQITPQRDIPPIHEAAAGSVRSEHRNVDILIPLARQRESPTGPNVPCERRTDPAEPHRQRALGIATPQRAFRIPRIPRSVPKLRPSERSFPSGGHSRKSRPHRSPAGPRPAASARKSCPYRGGGSSAC
jgi:hypothetical protein